MFDSRGHWDLWKLGAANVERMGGRLRPDASRGRPPFVRNGSVVCVVICALSIALGPTGASADAVSAKRREAAKLEASIAVMGDQLSALAENENEANIRLATLQLRLKKGEADLSKADVQAAQMEDRARRSALAALSEPFSNIGAFVEGAGAMDERERTAVLVRRARDLDRNALDALRASREDIARKRGVVAAARTETEALKAELEVKHRDADRLLTRYEVLERKAQGELKTLVLQAEKDRIAAEARRERAALAKRQEDARRLLASRQSAAAAASARTRAEALKKEADAAKRLAAIRQKGTKATAQEIAAAREAVADADTAFRSSTRSITRSSATDLAQLAIDAGAGSDLPPAPGGKSAVSLALAQIGKPYVWGASGPNSFDCSGLILYAWRAAGRSLPHSSRALYASTTRVSVNQIRVGDLVFYGSPIHHVGMYIGNGDMVEASRRGTPVRTRSIFRRDLVGVGRVG